jgi:hypothetical protein
MRVTRSHADYSPAVTKMACKLAFMHERKEARRYAGKMVETPPFIDSWLTVSAVFRSVDP